MKNNRGAVLVRSLSRLAALCATLLMASSVICWSTAQAATLEQIKLDYAYYSPESRVIRQQGWLEEEFAPDHTTINGS